MEALSVLHVFAYGAIIASAVYCFADARNKGRWISKLEKQLEEQHQELKQWQDKALIKHGSTPFVDKPKRMGTPKQQEITPKVVTRQQLEYRDADPKQSPVNIHAHDVSYQRVARTVEKVAEIIDAHK